MENQIDEWQSLSHWGLFKLDRPKPNLQSQFIKYRKPDYDTARITKTEA